MLSFNFSEKAGRQQMQALSNLSEPKIETPTSTVETSSPGLPSIDRLLSPSATPHIKQQAIASSIYPSAVGSPETLPLLSKTEGTYPGCIPHVISPSFLLAPDTDQSSTFDFDTSIKTDNDTSRSCGLKKAKPIEVDISQLVNEITRTESGPSNRQVTTLPTNINFIDTTNDRFIFGQPNTIIKQEVDSDIDMLLSDQEVTHPSLESTQFLPASDLVQLSPKQFITSSLSGPTMSSSTSIISPTNHLINVSSCGFNDVHNQSPPITDLSSLNIVLSSSQPTLVTSSNKPVYITSSNSTPVYLSSSSSSDTSSSSNEEFITLPIVDSNFFYSVGMKKKFMTSPLIQSHQYISSPQIKTSNQSQEQLVISPFGDTLIDGNVINSNLSEFKNNLPPNIINELPTQFANLSNQNNLISPSSISNTSSSAMSEVSVDKLSPVEEDITQHISDDFLNSVMTSLGLSQSPEESISVMSSSPESVSSLAESLSPLSLTVQQHLLNDNPNLQSDYQNILNGNINLQDNHQVSNVNKYVQFPSVSPETPSESMTSSESVTSSAGSHRRDSLNDDLTDNWLDGFIEMLDRPENDVLLM